jgi:hypothetical protein
MEINDHTGAWDAAPPEDPHDIITTENEAAYLELDQPKNHDLLPYSTFKPPSQPMRLRP